ncbi:hypothetical protein [Cupriavidus basilensis]|uniref:hypothetical protein n=1 Tax=Cupriavidus basilensis TaxID=68895 RepID=UPI0028498D17|nr:hypothetical protein [Cupriavidus basilensis]MDR3383402.1 hypothetical protein [Cupriavidus basilensis]
MKLTNSEDFTVSAGLATGLRAILLFSSRALTVGDGCGDPVVTAVVTVAAVFLAAPDRPAARVWSNIDFA